MDCEKGSQKRNVVFVLELERRDALAHLRSFGYLDCFGEEHVFSDEVNFNQLIKGIKKGIVRLYRFHMMLSTFMCIRVNVL